MDAKKLLEKCGVKSKEACEGQGELEYFVEAVEVGRDMARVDSVKGLDVTNSEAKKVVVAKKVVEDEEKVEQYLELQDKGETFRLPSLRVNLAGGSARNLPGVDRVRSTLGRGMPLRRWTSRDRSSLGWSRSRWRSFGLGQGRL